MPNFAILPKKIKDVMRFSKFYILIAHLLFFLSADAQDQAPTATLSSPYNTVYVHLYYLQPDSYEPEIAAKTIYLPGDTIRAKKLAIQLKQIFDGNGLFVQLNLLPQTNDFVDTLSQKPYFTPFPKRLPQVYLEKINGKWYYSSQTVAAIPAMHKELYPFGTDFLVNFFPESVRHQRFLGLAAWQWLGLLILLAGALILHFLLSRIFRPFIRLLTRSKFSQPLEDKSKIWRVSKLASIVVLLWAVKSLLPLLQLSIGTMVWLMNGLKIATAIMVVMLALSIIDVVMAYAFRYAYTTEHKLDEQLLPILKRMLKILVVLGGIIYILRLLNVNVTALIAGVSIGGLALALAAQDTVKNLIGSAMIFFDKPFEVGDWVIFNGIEGSIREVGFRSTRIEMIDNSIVTVPNDQIASSAVTNMGIRKFRLVKKTLGVTYDTPPVLLEKFIGALRRLVEQHPLTRKDNFLIYFHSFGDSSLNIYFRTHIEVGSFQEELEEREKLAFGILRIANDLGVRFAFPTQTLFVEELPGSGNTTPTYETDPTKLDLRVKDYFEKFGQPPLPDDV